MAIGQFSLSFLKEGPIDLIPSQECCSWQTWVSSEKAIKMHISGEGIDEIINPKLLWAKYWQLLTWDIKQIQGVGLLDNLDLLFDISLQANIKQISHLINIEYISLLRVNKFFFTDNILIGKQCLDFVIFLIIASLTFLNQTLSTSLTSILTPQMYSGSMIRWVFACNLLEYEFNIIYASNASTAFNVSEALYLHFSFQRLTKTSVQAVVVNMHILMSGFLLLHIINSTVRAYHSIMIRTSVLLTEFYNVEL